MSATATTMHADLTDAADRNGWTIDSYLFIPADTGTVDSAIVLCYRAGQSDYLTALAVIHPGRAPYFESGHYDMDLPDARLDYLDRCKRAILSL